MAVLRHTVSLAPVPLPWLADALAVLLDLAEGTRAEAGRVLLPDGRTVPDVRLAEGRHLRPGAVYESTGDARETVRVGVEEWHRRRALRLALAVSASDAEVEGRGVLRRPDRPRLVEIDGRARVAGVWSALSRVSGSARLRCDDWWAAAESGHRGRTAPLRARVECGAGRAELRAVPAPGGLDGHWRVTVTVRIRGRRLYRPVAAIALTLVRGRLQRSFATTLNDLATHWNTEIPRVLALPPESLHRELLPTDPTAP